jgi:hypothetical protein
MQHIQTAFISLVSTLMLSPLVQASDPGTYRPGQPYAATTAASHSQCQAQCQGDAACRGWNFVRANPRQKDGICEFNSRAVSPIQSLISVSANQSQVINPTGQSRIIPAGVRTTRIGTPQTMKNTPARRPAIPAQNAKRMTAPKTPTSGHSRRVIRQALPNQLTPQASRYRHSLGSAPQQLNRQSMPPQRLNAQDNRGRQSSPVQNAPHITRTSNGLPPRAAAASTQSQRPQALPLAQQPQQPQTAQAPRRGGLIRALTGEAPNAQPRAPLPPQASAAPPKAYAAQRPQRLANTARLSAEEAGQRSLYGHLNDDVAVPKVLTAEDLALPNDQAIPTVTSVPVKPVNREAFTGLAGG